MRGIFKIHAPHLTKVGLGDAVAAVSQPIAKAVDAVAGTKLAECGGCKQRRQRMNYLVPDLAAPFRRDKLDAKK